MEITLTIYNNFAKYSTDTRFKYYVSINEHDINLPVKYYDSKFKDTQKFITFNFQLKHKINPYLIMTEFIYKLNSVNGMYIYQTLTDEVKKIKELKFDNKLNLLIDYKPNSDYVILCKFIECINDLIQCGKISVFDIYDNINYRSHYYFKSVDGIYECIKDIKNDYDDFLINE